MYWKVIMKKLIIILLCLCLYGCTSNEYIRDTSEGERKFITLQEMVDKIKNQDDFVVILSQSTCEDCANLNTLLKEYILEHHVIVYEVMLDFEETSAEDNLKVIHTYFEDFAVTPSIYYLEKGELIDYLEMEGDDVTEEIFDTWVVKHKLDKKI